MTHKKELETIHELLDTAADWVNGIIEDNNSVINEKSEDDLYYAIEDTQKALLMLQKIADQWLGD